MSNQPEAHALYVVLTAEFRAVIEEAASVLESAAAHNRSENRTVLAHSQQGRADRLRLGIAAGAPAETPKPVCQGMLTECPTCKNDMRKCVKFAAQPAPAPAAKNAREARRIGYWYPEHGQAFISDTAPPGSEPIYAAMLSANSPREAG